MPHRDPVKRKRYLKAWHRKHPKKQALYDSRRTPGYWRSMHSRYGVTRAVYELMCKAQKNRCAVCRKKDTVLGSGGKLKALSVDHCHRAGTVRGLLCFRCNLGLGTVDDNIPVLRSMIRYLKRTA